MIPLPFPPVWKPGRRIVGISAILLPFSRVPQTVAEVPGAIDWHAFDRALQRTAAAGLVPAVNMDTGYGPQLDAGTRKAVLQRTRQVLGEASFCAGAIVTDSPGSAFDLESYRRAIDPIVDLRGTPVIFPSYGLSWGSDERMLDSYRRIAEHCDTFIAFELGEMFAPFGRIHSLELYRGWLEIPECIGAKHSSLSRRAEWERLALRDELRPDFHVFTGNDLAIDMVFYGSDYLLGLSALAPEEFALRDRLWESGDLGCFEVNDALQALGAFAFRAPVPAYKHTAAMFHRLRGWCDCDATFPGSPQRPDSDREILAELLRRLKP